MVNQNTVYNHVLHVAPNYKRRKGGIASVLNLYSKTIPSFHFFPSAYFQHKILNFMFLPLLCVGFIVRLFFAGKSIEIIHIHGASRGSFYRKYFFYWIAKKLFRKKVIYHIHGAEYHIFYANATQQVRRKIKHMINSCDAIIALSVEWSKFFSEEFAPKKLFILNNIVEYREEKKCQEKITQIQLVFLGRIGKRKGTFDLVEAIINHKTYFKDKIRVVIGGDGETEQLKKMISTNNLSTFVNYVGWVSGQKKKELLTNSNLLVLPSYNEGLPISLLEGMSYAMPIIATDVGGIPQIVENGKNGISIKPGNTKQLADAIRFYIENPDKICTHGNASYQKAQDFFPEKIVQKLEGIYVKMK